MPSNPYESPKPDSSSNASQHRPVALLRLLAFAVTFLFGVVISQVVAYFGFLASGSAPNDFPGLFIFLGVFGVIFGFVGGFFANLYCIQRIPWFYIVVAFGIFTVGLALIQSPNYSGAAKLIAAISVAQMIATLSIGIVCRRFAARDRTT